MESPDKSFVVSAVKELLKQVKEGKVHLLEDQVPQTVAEVKAVRVDDAGEPIYETIGPLVRALARAVVGHKEWSERKAQSPVHEFLGEPARVDDDVLKECATKGSFSPLAFELYKETVTVLSVCSHAYFAPEPEQAGLPRNQAICAGLLVRITKYMVAVARLITDPGCGEVVMSLNRCITESATNLRFLVFKNEDRFFDQFVEFSLSPERELYDVIQKNIAARGQVLPIEERMMSSVERLCDVSGVKIQDVPVKTGDWGGGLRNRLKALGEGDTYAGLQRIQSHAVHGTWVDLVMRHLTKVEGGFQPDPTWSPVDSRLMLPICVLVLAAAHAYVEGFFPRVPELDPLYERIADLDQRIHRVDRAHEDWFNRTNQDDTQEG